MSGQYCITLTTTNSQQNSQQIISSVLSRSLVACIQTMPIQSHYIWQGKVCCDDEILLVMKTKRSCYAELEQTIVEQHDYGVPQVVQIPFSEGFNPYLAWLEQNTRC
ncbi:divalent-cation tolerance protein CutA [Vibrio sp. JPW-9-11-11]|uniref:divalent-cation tolerance protein CutA n=1 Tax=Vibrio sp. JPW-9-11-11 TaxID=1416532 RepID=UPI001594903A|nr:divalent-cation tolerance protein CutA [Vibrio sp. JPW-9-11-11]NVD07952.1 divalent-cation tolerance protein CutA [Vibrio sp. JPW-9-11-11]